MTTELLRPNQYDLFAKTMNVRDLIAEKIENRTGGNFVGPWSDAISYNDGDIVIYTGCLYTSIANDNLNNIPSQTSAFWNAASLLKNSRLYNVNNVIGDDSKAVVPCGGPYPFRTLDAAWDQAVLDNPNGRFIIFLQYGNNDPYTFSRDISGINSIAMVAQDPNKIFVDITTKINLFCDIMEFTNITFRGLFESTDIQPMFSIRPRRNNLFKNCTFGYYIDGTLNTVNTGIEILPTTVFNNSRLIFEGCKFFSAATRITIKDAPTLASADYITTISFINGNSDTTSNFLLEDLPAVNPSTIPGQFKVFIINHDVKYQTNNIASLYMNNCRQNRDLISNLNSPGFLELCNVQFYAFDGDRSLKRLIKNGDAYYRFVDFLKANSSIAPSVIPGSYDVTSGPKYDYVAWNTYDTGDLVVKDGALYKCAIDGTIGVTPDYASPNWDVPNVNLVSKFGTGATLTLVAATSEQLLPVGAIDQDPYSMVSVAANIITLAKAGLYEVVIGMTSATTQTAGQDDIFNVYINKDTVTPTYASAESISELTRGLVSNSVTFPTSNKTITLAVQTATPGESFGIYIRNTSGLSYDVNMRNMVIKRIN